jgi:prepilin-type N-terminal cleavage/methylation domain-containing protein
MPVSLRKPDDGFTLVEVLVVIAILGILAGVVLFSVSGLSDRGQASACKSEKTTLTTAQEAYFASPSGNGHYAASAGALKAAGMIGSLPTWYGTASSTPFTSYTVTVNVTGTSVGCS